MAELFSPMTFSQRNLKMSLKLKALIILLSIISITLTGVLALDYIVTNVAIGTIKNTLAIGLGVMVLYFMYGIILGHLEYDQKVKEIEEKQKK